MAHALLLNPSKPRKAAKKRARARKRNPGWFTKGHKAKHGSRARRRRANPMSNPPRRSYRHARRNPIRARRRRRNPLGGGIVRGIVGMLKGAAIEGVAAAGLDYIYGQVATNALPSTLQIQIGQPGAGDALKAGVALLLGTVLDKPTKGLARTAAGGWLTVQFYQLIEDQISNQGMQNTSGLGFMNPGPTVPFQSWGRRTTPYPRHGAGMKALLRPGFRSPAMGTLVKPMPRSQGFPRQLAHVADAPAGMGL